MIDKVILDAPEFLRPALIEWARTAKVDAPDVISCDTLGVRCRRCGQVGWAAPWLVEASVVMAVTKAFALAHDACPKGDGT